MSVTSRDQHRVTTHAPKPPLWTLAPCQDRHFTAVREWTVYTHLLLSMKTTELLLLAVGRSRLYNRP